ncbi:MAG: hypothetical protein M9938_04845 [Solirubrobacterales bacterium]|nr:hypothetical protein [Solirubrobacterales bacterium]
MNPLKRVATGLLLFVLTATAVVATAGAAVDAGPNGERIAVSMTVKPGKGHLYRAGSVPVKFGVDVAVDVPTGTPAVTPTRKGKVGLPPDLTFHPKASMPVCTDDRLNPGMSLSIPPREVIAKCPGSVIGNGTANLHVAGMKAASVDALLLIFHAGFTSSGRPKIKIWGYTKQLNAGVLMQGMLQPDNTLEITVPPLPVKTAIGRYDLNVPGTKLLSYDGRPVPGSLGLDPTYVKARCSSGSWRLSAVATLGAYNDDGSPDGPEYPVAAPDFTRACQGLPGRPPSTTARIGRVRVEGRTVVNRGSRTRFRVTVTNPGGSVLKGVRVLVRARGVRAATRLGAVPAGRSRTVPITVRFSRKGRFRVGFTVRSGNGGAKRVARTVRVR